MRTIVYAVANAVAEDLYTIVKTATISVEKKVTQNYASLLRDKLGFAQPVEAPSTPRNGAGNGSA